MPAFWMYATGGVALGSEGFKDSKCWSMEMCPHEPDDEKVLEIRQGEATLT